MKAIDVLDRRGFISLKALFYIIFLSSAIYASYKFVPPYFSYYMLKTDVENEAKIAHMYTDADLAKHIITKAETWNVPITKDDIEIARDATNINVTVRYSETLNFFDRYTKTIDFVVSVDKPLAEKSGILH